MKRLLPAMALGFAGAFFAASFSAPVTTLNAYPFGVSQAANTVVPSHAQYEALRPQFCA